jgi:hypothetical protein
LALLWSPLETGEIIVEVKRNNRTSGGQLTVLTRCRMAVQGSGRSSGSSPSKVTGGKAAVSGARGRHFRRRFRRSLYSSCKTVSRV